MSFYIFKTYYLCKICIFYEIKVFSKNLIEVIARSKFRAEVKFYDPPATSGKHFCIKSAILQCYITIITQSSWIPWSQLLLFLLLQFAGMEVHTVEDVPMDNSILNFVTYWMWNIFKCFELHLIKLYPDKQ